MADHITDGEAAALMRCSRVTIRRLRYRGELPTTRVGAKVLIPRQAVEDYLAVHTTKADAS
jgi:excisionase family DNA binding protein